MTGFIIFFVLIGLLLVAVAIPLIRGKIKPNSWYGFRVRATLDNPDVWYPVNAYAGKRLLALGVVSIVFSVLIPLIWPSITLDAYAVAVTVIWIGGMLLILIVGMRYANALSAKMDRR
ncbi:MAG: SdpI family protein [Anaerolineae bacterium]|nr:SdpI family protein [Anaerolineae bacterium]